MATTAFDIVESHLDLLDDINDYISYQPLNGGGIQLCGNIQQIPQFKSKSLKSGYLNVYFKGQALEIKITRTTLIEIYKTKVLSDPKLFIPICKKAMSKFNQKIGSSFEFKKNSFIEDIKDINNSMELMGAIYDGFKFIDYFAHGYKFMSKPSSNIKIGTVVSAGSNIMGKVEQILKNSIKVSTADGKAYQFKKSDVHPDSRNLARNFDRKLRTTFPNHDLPAKIVLKPHANIDLVKKVNQRLNQYLSKKARE